MKRRSGMVLILVLIVMLVGGALVYVATDMAGNAHNSAMNMITEDRLYNAAQSGLEWGKAILWIYRDHLEEDQISGVNSLEDLYSRKDDGSEGTVGSISNYALANQTKYPDGAINLPPKPVFFQPAIQVDVEILDCNYDLALGVKPDGFPPMIPFGAYDTSGEGGSVSLVGFSNVMDPNRNISFGSGGRTGTHAFVIRSTSRAQDGTGRTKSVETMVVINHDE